MEYASYYIGVDDRIVVEEGGYRTFPYAMGRYITTPGETYGRSPAMLVLPDIKMLNEMKKTIIRGAHLAVRPPLLLQEDGALQAFDMRPDALNFGGVDSNGNPLVHPLNTGGDHRLGLDLIEAQQRVINDAFLVTLFQILVDQPTMTATEAMLRAQEKGALLAPTMGRQQSEMLGPMIERELDILAYAGALPPMPQELIDAGGNIEVEYVSPLNRAQRAEEGVAIMRTFEAIAPLAQIDPRVMKAFNPVLAARELAEINGMPAKIIRSDEEIDAMDAAEEQQMAAAQLLEAAPVAAQTAKTMAETQQIASQGQPYVQ
jgi:Bacteriophage head to tail connecting protein